MRRFLLAFGAAAVILAGAGSYLADSDPDGLDTVTLRGCEVVRTAEGERLRGSCIAKQSEEHTLAHGPLAGYAVDGAEGSTGIAGVLGFAATALLSGGLFWALRRRRNDAARGS